MVGFLVLFFPLVLLVFVLLMERVERPMSRGSTQREIEHFLDDASPEELNTFVREGTESALSRFRQRLHPRKLRRHRPVAAESPRS